MTTQKLFDNGIFQIYRETTLSGMPVNVYFMMNEEYFFSVESLWQFLEALPEEIKEDLSTRIIPPRRQLAPAFRDLRTLVDDN